MKKGLLQEKFQRTMERPKREDREWASFKSQRRVAPDMEMRTYTTSPAKKRTVLGGINADFSAPITNRMPPGQEIKDQVQAVIKDQPYSNAGATDESNSVNAKMLIDGFQRQNMRPEDEMYNDEHVELFYGTASGEDDAGNKYDGYVERNNYLDRE